MPNLLTPGELSVGMIVTVLENKPSTPNYAESSLYDTEGKEWKSMVAQSQGNKNGYGHTYKVLAVNLPYIVVITVGAHSYGAKPIPCDTREIVFMEVSEDYARAMGAKE